jgi:3-oxoacyl-[acyl-carrier-protein] synthase III
MTSAMAALALGPVSGILIEGCGTAFPRAHELDNVEVLRLLAAANAAPVDEERLRFQADGLTTTLGVKRRAWARLPGSAPGSAGAPDEETSADLAARAAAAALLDAGLLAEDLDAILVSSSTPPRWTQTLSAQVGARLAASTAGGRDVAPRAMCLDVRAGCAAGIAAFAQAALLVQAGARHVLVVGAETFSKVIPPAHKMAWLSLADGAGAIIVGPSTDPGQALESWSFTSDGKKAGLIAVPGALPPTAADIAAGRYFLDGELAGLEEAIPLFYERVLDAALARAGVGASDLASSGRAPRGIDLLVPHQTSRPLLEKVAALAGVPLARTWRAVERHANVGAAGWLVAFAEARAEGHIQPGMRIAVAAVGGGMSGGAMVLSC